MSSSDRFAALRYRDFRLLWLGLLVSVIGSQMQFAAINWHIFILTGSPLALGLIGLFRFIPISIFALVSGSVADAHNRKKILFVTQIILAFFSLVLTITTFLEIITPQLIYIVTALSAVALAFENPPRQALIPRLVENQHLANALSLNVIMRQTATVIGPTLAGIVIAQGGLANVYLINAVSFFAVIISLLLMKTSGAIEGEPGKVSLQSIIEGLSFVKSQTIIWSTMVLDFFSTFFATATGLLPIFAAEILKVGPTGFGLLHSAPSVGAIAAGYWIAHKGTLKNEGRLLLTSVVIYALATIVFGFSKFFWLSLVALFFVGAGDSVSTIIRQTIRQTTTPDYIRGRMTSVNMIFSMGGPQLGRFESGVLAALIGTPLAVVFGGLATLAVVAVVATKIPALKNYSGEKSN